MLNVQEFGLKLNIEELLAVFLEASWAVFPTHILYLDGPLGIFWPLAVILSITWWHLLSILCCSCSVFLLVTFSKCSSSSDCLIKSETVVTIRTPERRFSENVNSVCDCLQHSHFLFPKFKFDLLNLFHLSHFFLYVRVLSTAALE